ncbi:MAG: LPS export ABC transporter periplasmic protein LptC [Crocinitomicaceae bacterium]|nr:LPS export ABC transporter periplasmic protein LptC [Crocinitomicaceae bacterium]
MRTHIFPLLIFLVGMIYSCVNDESEVKRITDFEDAPDEQSQNVKMVYSDSGLTKFHLYADISETYTQPKQITNFRNFVKVDFFNSEGLLVSTLTAQRGVYDHAEELVVVNDSVRLYNYKKDQTLETEELTWNKKDSTIRTNSQVVVSSPKELLTGKGLVTKQDFSYFEILNPTGRLNLKKEE